MQWLTGSTACPRAHGSNRSSATACWGSLCCRCFVCASRFPWCTCALASEAHLQFTAASLAHCPNLCLLILPCFVFFFFALFSSVYCFGLQLLYLFRLTGGLALPFGSGIGNRLAEKGEDNRDRQGLDHTHTHTPTSSAKSLLNNSSYAS